MLEIVQPQYAIDSEWKSLYCNTQTNTKDEGRESLPPQDLLQHAPNF